MSMTVYKYRQLFSHALARLRLFVHVQAPLHDADAALQSRAQPCNAF